MKEINEGMFKSSIQRSNSDRVRKEDEFTNYAKQVLDVYVDLFADRVTPDGDYEIELNDFLAFIDDYSNNIKIEKFHPDVERIKGFVKDNWDKGECYEDIVNGAVDQVMKELHDDLYEGMFKASIQRSNSNRVRKEDELDELNKEVLDRYIEMYTDPNSFDGYKIRGNGNGLMSFKQYVLKYNDIFIFVTDYRGYDVPTIVDYIEKNWKKVSDIIDAKANENGLNECDIVSPNGGIVFGDIQGMGPITFPGECGERGSGDLPMPSGKVYQQVAPFSKFIKKKKKKKKKFRKEDEACAKYSNPPIYNHVDDYREYVDRTYNNIDKMK